MAVAGQTASHLAVLIGVIFGGYQFLEAQKDAKVQRTMDYILRYEEGHVGEARRAINTALRPHISAFEELDAAGVTRAQKQEMLTTILGAEDDHLFDRVDTVIDFYEGLATCVGERICDGQVADGYFGPSEAPGFWSNFEPYVMERRVNNPAFARGLELIARRQAIPSAKD